MPRYIIERNVEGIRLEDLAEAGKKSNEVLAEMKAVTWIRSYVSEAEGKIYCEYEAPDKDAVREHARLAGLPADRITEIQLEINPAMFQ
jgi:hypothetical protein